VAPALDGIGSYRTRASPCSCCSSGDGCSRRCQDPTGAKAFGLRPSFAFMRTRFVLISLIVRIHACGLLRFDALPCLRAAASAEHTDSRTRRGKRKISYPGPPRILSHPTHISQAAPDSQRRSCYAYFSAVILCYPRLCTPVRDSTGIGRRLRDPPDRSQLSPFRCFGRGSLPLSGVRFVRSMARSQAVLGHLRSMIGSHFFIFGWPIALATFCYHPPPHGTPTAPGHGVTTVRHACYAAASVCLEHH
jgi:hypothetical protein